MTLYAIIPARLGSKRLPRKNLALLGGRPLIEWTLEAAVKSGIFLPENIYVSTESFQAGLIAHQAGVAWASASRIPEIANDPNRGVEDVLRNLEMATDVIYYVLLATSPFRTSESIMAAWSAFRAEPGADGLLSLVEMPMPPQWALDAECKELWPGGRAIMRHNLVKGYQHDGGHFIIRKDALSKAEKDRFMVPFFPPLEETLDIDTKRDLDFAEFLLGTRKTGN